MEEKRINIAEILKDCPKGTKLWSPLFGEVVFEEITYKNNILVTGKISKFNDICFRECFTEFGKWSNYYNTECLLFPSKDNRDWSTFKVNKPKFDPNTLQNFDQILKRNEQSKIWFSDFISCKRNDAFVTIGGGHYDVLIPYNDETKHLAGTTDEAPEFYRYWEE